MEYRYVAADIREYLHIADSRYHIFTTAGKCKYSSNGINHGGSPPIDGLTGGPTGIAGHHICLVFNRPGGKQCVQLGDALFRPL